MANDINGASGDAMLVLLSPARCKAIRTGLGLSLRKAAKLAAVSPSMLHRYEQGDMRVAVVKVEQITTVLQERAGAVLAHHRAAAFKNRGRW